MQDLLKKIIEMDEQARKIEQQAKSEKLASEAEIDELREKIYNDYIIRAKDRIEKNIAVDKAHADEKLAAFEKEAEKLKSDMDNKCSAEKERWVNEIVSRVLA